MNTSHIYTQTEGACMPLKNTSRGIIFSTENATFPRSTKWRNSDSLVSRGKNSNWDFNLVCEVVAKNLSFLVVQCVSVRCNVLQCVAETLWAWGMYVAQEKCVAVCCSVLQCVAVCCRNLVSFVTLWAWLGAWYVCCSREMCCKVLQYGAVWCSVLRCVAVCCRSVARYVCCSRRNVLQCVAVWCSVLQCATECFRVLQKPC